MVHPLVRLCLLTLFVLMQLSLLPISSQAQDATPSSREDLATAASAGNVLRVDQGSVEFDANFPIDPQKSLSSPQIATSGLDYEGLTRLDSDMNTVPAAAESWDVSSDGTTLTFHLREGLTYSDGSPLTAERFRYAVERTCDPRTEAPYATILFDIVGCEAFFTSIDPALAAATPGAVPGTPEATASYEAAKANLGVRAIDERTLEIHLVQPAAYFPTIASIWVFYPVQQEAVERNPEGWWRDPTTRVGNGPFRMAAIDLDEPDRRIRFAANDRYWAGRPRLDGIEYIYFPEGDLLAGLEAFRRGEVDITYPPLPAVEADQVLSQQLQRYPAAQTFMLAFNQKAEPFQDKKVREAFAYAFDRDAYCEEVIGPIFESPCVPALSWIPPGLAGHIETDAYAFDPEAARQALAESSYGEPGNLPEITWYYYYAEDWDRDQREAEWVAEQYREVLGVELTLKPTSDEEFRAMEEAEFVPQLNFADWFQDYPDPQNWLSLIWTCGSTVYGERFGYCNPEFDALVREADREPDPDKRLALYEEAGRLLVADVPGIFLLNSENVALVTPRLSGYVTTTLDQWPGWTTLLTMELAPIATPAAGTPAP